MEPDRRKEDLSPGQLKLVREASRDAVRSYRNRAVVGFLVLLGGVGYLWNTQERLSIDRAKDAQTQREQIVKSGNIVAVTSCNERFRDRQAIRGVLLASKAIQRASYRRGTISRERYLQGREFFTEQLNNMPLLDCRKSAHILTDDPDKELKIPAPLYPKPQREKK